MYACVCVCYDSEYWLAIVSATNTTCVVCKCLSVCKLCVCTCASRCMYVCVCVCHYSQYRLAIVSATNTTCVVCICVCVCYDSEYWLAIVSATNTTCVICICVSVCKLCVCTCACRCMHAFACVCVCASWFVLPIGHSLSNKHNFAVGRHSNATWVRQALWRCECFNEIISLPWVERWEAGVETQKNVRGEIGGWGRVPFNETYAPSLSTIYNGACKSLNFLKMVLDPSPPPLRGSCAVGMYSCLCVRHYYFIWRPWRIHICDVNDTATPLGCVMHG